MLLGMDTNPIHAMARFGLGRRPSEPLPADPAAWLLGQLRQVDSPRIDPPPSTESGLAALHDDRTAKPEPGQSRARKLFAAQAAAELEHALTTATPFRERLVWFWTNHFTVSLRRGECASVACAFVEEAIRPYVAGPFSDMVLAVMRHPAMLLYLDNARSVGPDSPAGQGGKRGLNENLAREFLELHSVSPAAGYSQADVTSLARILTGWSIEVAGDPKGFVYRPRAHEPGSHTLMGHAFPSGEAGGVAALRFLAEHPATYRFLATKMVRHFVADDPPPADVRRIETALRDSHGNLGTAAAALVGLESAWTPGTKLRTPREFMVAAVRSLDLPAGERPNMAGVLRLLGEPFLTAPAPNGWPDTGADWSAPEAMMRRIDWANGFAGRLGPRDPVEVAGLALGPLLRPATLEAMRRAGSRRDAFTLMLTSPEFQRR
jgi:uncharacterized protein (DUF1800 family)